MYAADSNFSGFAWPIGIRGDIDENDNGIKGPHTSNWKDNVHLCDVIATDNLDESGHLEYIPSREVVKALDLDRCRHTDYSTVLLM